MRCPECGAVCWRNEIDVGVGIVSDEWKCEQCNWDENQAFPMTAENWEDFLRADDWAIDALLQPSGIVR